jgi:hypothetical protein
VHDALIVEPPLLELLEVLVEPALGLVPRRQESSIRLHTALQVVFVGEDEPISLTNQSLLLRDRVGRRIVGEDGFGNEGKPQEGQRQPPDRL